MLFPLLLQLNYLVEKYDMFSIFIYCTIWSIWLFTRWFRHIVINTFFSILNNLVVSILWPSHNPLLCPLLCKFHPQFRVKHHTCWMISYTLEFLYVASWNLWIVNLLCVSFGYLSLHIPFYLIVLLMIKLLLFILLANKGVRRI